MFDKKPKEAPMDEIQDATLSEEINRLHAEHRRYAQRLEELIQKPYLTVDEQLEDVRLKKLQRHAKDLIYALERGTAVMAYHRNRAAKDGAGGALDPSKERVRSDRTYQEAPRIN